MKFPRLAGLVALALVSMAAQGAENSAPAETAFLPGKTAGAAGEQKPIVLKIAVNDIYCKQTACSCISNVATRDYSVLLSELKFRHRVTLEFQYFPEQFDLDKAVQSGKFDGVLCKPWSALRLADQAGAKFRRLADVLDPDNQAMMTGMFITTKESPIQTLADLQGRKIAIGQSDSYEKNQAPLRMLAEKNIRTQEPVCHSSCGENLDDLMSGAVDAAVISSYAFTATCAVDFAKADDFRVIAKTPPMPLTSLMLDMNKVSEADAARVQAALVAVSGKKLPKDFKGHGFVMPASWKPAPAKGEK